jgi:hypothetical protein
MKNLVFIIIPALMLVMSSFSGCEIKEMRVQETPVIVIKELPKMYLEGNLYVAAGEHAIIQSQTELSALFSQETIENSSDLQEIDFETQTLLIGRDDYHYNAVFNYEFSTTAENEYLFTVNIFGGYAVMDYGFWYGIIISKLPTNAEVVFNINKQNNQ